MEADILGTRVEWRRRSWREPIIRTVSRETLISRGLVGLYVRNHVEIVPP